MPRPQPDADEPKRVFRDVTQVGRPTLSLGADESDDLDESSAPTSDTANFAGASEAASDKRTSSDSLLARLKRLEPGRLRAPKSEPEEPEAHQEALEGALDDELLTIADEVANSVADVAEPEPKPEPDTADREPEPEPDAADREPEPEPEPEPDADIREPEPDAGDRGPATDNRSPKPPPPTPLSEADKTGPWPIRVDDVIYDPVDEEALATLLKSGVWLEVIELGLESGRWMPLEQHPAYPSVRKRLLRRTQQIVEHITTGEWDREANQAMRSGGSPPAEPAPVQPQGSPRGRGPANDQDQAPDHDHVRERERDRRRRDRDSDRDRRRSIEPVTPKERPSTAWPHRLLLTLTIIASLTVGAALAVAVVDWLEGAEQASGASAAAGDIRPEDVPVLAIPPTSEPTEKDWREAIDKAREHVGVAAREDTFAAALMAQEQAGDGRYELARELLLEAMVARGVKPHLKRVFNEALAADPALQQKVVTFGVAKKSVDERVGRIHALGGGRSVSLRITKGGRNAFAFKPAQDEWNNGWRAEVASYVFCEFVPCQFEVPRNRPARISRADFEELYAKVDGDWQTTYAERFGALHWVEEAGPDGTEREYLYGTLKDWVPGFIDWPIEYTGLWKEWLDVRFHPDNLSEPYREAIAPLKELGEGKFYKKALAEQGDATLRDVARQLSAILVFDYLTHNWDRFSSTPEYYGVNNQFADGTFISLDNGAAFYDQPVPEVEPRIELTTRFSHRMITAVRALSPETVNELLFPNPNWNERKRLEIFWKQRRKLMQRVDELVAHYGEERVFEFQ